MSVQDLLSALGMYPDCKDPHGQMDCVVVERCRQLSTKVDLKADDIKALLDDIVKYSLATDFVVAYLGAIWNMQKDKENEPHPSPP